MEHFEINNLTSTSTNVLRIRDCGRQYSEPMTSHALGGLAYSRRTLLHMQLQAAGGRHCRHFERMLPSKKQDLISEIRL